MAQHRVAARAQFGDVGGVSLERRDARVHVVRIDRVDRIEVESVASRTTQAGAVGMAAGPVNSECKPLLCRPLARMAKPCGGSCLQPSVRRVNGFGDRVGDIAARARRPAHVRVDHEPDLALDVAARCGQLDERRAGMRGRLVDEKPRQQRDAGAGRARAMLRGWLLVTNAKRRPAAKRASHWCGVCASASS